MAVAEQAPQGSASYYEQLDMLDMSGVCASTFARGVVRHADDSVSTVLLKQVGTSVTAPPDGVQEARHATYLGRMGASDVAVTPTALVVQRAPRGEVLWVELPVFSDSARGLLLDGVLRSAAHRAAVAHGVCHAVHRLHELGIVHSDVKQGNTVLAGDGSVRLLDYDGTMEAWEGRTLLEQGGPQGCLCTQTVRPPEWEENTDVFPPDWMRTGDVFSAATTAAATLFLRDAHVFYWDTLKLPPGSDSALRNERVNDLLVRVANSSVGNVGGRIVPLIHRPGRAHAVQRHAA